MNRQILLLILLITYTGFAQNSGNIKGVVTSEKNEAVSEANINIEGASIGTRTNTNGSFNINNVPEGNYLLRISYIGFKSQQIAISIEGGATTQLPNIVLKVSEEELNEVVINGNGNANKFNREKSAYVSKLPLKNIENPQVYDNITAEILNEQIVTSFDDALKNSSGITKLWESTGRGGDGAGYYSLRGFPVQPNLVNGLPAITNGSPDPANIENIEVIKGPSGTLYGSSLISYGGLINITTKKPYDYFGGNISYTLGSFGLNRVAADINTPLDEEGDIALRVNTAYQTKNSFQDAGFSKSFFIAPSFSYKVNDRLSFLVNTEFYNGKSTNPTMLFLDRGAPLTATNIDELNYDTNRSYTSNDLTLENPTYSLQGQMNYKLSDEWTSQTVISRGSAKSKGYYSYLYEGTRFVEGLDEGVVFTRFMNNQNSTTLTTDFQQNFIGDFEIFGMRNRMVAGLDYFQREVIDNGTGYVGNGSVYIGNASLQNVNESVFGIFEQENYITDGDSGILSTAAVDGLLENIERNNIHTKEDIYSAYVSNVLNITPALSVMASLRIDQFENDSNSQTALSPKFGVVYQPIIDKVSIFANYMDGFSNVAPSEAIDQSTGETRRITFDPEHASQFEFGTKLNFLNDKLFATLSYYDIEVENIVLGSGFEVTQDGTQYSRGFEARITASPIDGLNLVAGFSHNDSEVTEATANDDFLGRRPESAGPENLANLWASYRLTSGAAEGFGIGFGGNYASENMIFNRNIAGTFTLPSYTVLNAAVFYDVDQFSINLKLNNLTNEDYFNGWSTINPQAPRNFAAALTYNF
ncbi:TonB-dependent receptor [Christiangramia forsetii]|uniref:TonB-dependent outer membrane receptor n=2 Tax=Christiangramia forsetii TaxID=411153 RepID=A0M3G1_CHRFK|nr:TonB-dependent receptor [Christiangramia forsetii]GGG25946.1 TonB-dependent receptor [Christiangramia forsetii]CAL67156.1 TonB-dependent outer membrane receptor [Christiangramia forsetii KT0803]